ncbi:MAG: DUF3795 domain-containing protein [Syntrophobacteraceae bacterium]
MVDPNLVASCGLYCGACAAYLKEKCPGCRENEKASWCKVRACCLARGYATCAECGDYSDPRACGKYNNFISKLFGLVFNSNRAACIDQLKDLGIEGHAKKMAEMRMRTIRRR